MEFLGFNSANKSIVYLSTRLIPFRKTFTPLSETNLKRTARHNADYRHRANLFFDRRDFHSSNTSNAVNEWKPLKTTVKESRR